MDRRVPYTHLPLGVFLKVSLRSVLEWKYSAVAENYQTRSTPGKYPAIIESPGYAEDEFNDFIFTDRLCFLFHHAFKCTLCIISLCACDFYGSTGQLILYDWKGCKDHLVLIILHTWIPCVFKANRLCLVGLCYLLGAV